jgi:hypothetical protein
MRSVWIHSNEGLRLNSFVVTEGKKYGPMYFLSPRLQAGIGLLAEMVTALHFELDASR